MKTTTPKIAGFLELLFKTIVSILRIIVFSKNVKKLRKLNPDVNKIYILGNSPSLNKELSEFQDAVCNAALMSVNYFANSEWYKKLKPEFYVIIDRFVFADNYDKSNDKKNIEFFNKLSEDTTWKMCLFMPFEAKKHSHWQSALRKNKNINIFYINLTPIEGFDFFVNKCFDRNYGMPRPHNVLIPSIYLALLFNIKEIFIMGAEHSWLPDIFVNHDNKVMIKEAHFYSSDKKERELFYNTPKGKRPVKYHEALYTYMVAFRSYYIIKSYAEYKKCKIVNCTEHSFIDAFPKEKPAKK